MTWGTCGSCYWWKKQQATLCADQADADHECEIGMYRPRKLRGKAKRKTRGTSLRGGA